MTWAAARDHLTSTVETTTPPNAGPHAPASAPFFHDVEGTSTRVRSFHWRVRQVSTVTPIPPGFQRLAISLIVSYPVERSIEALDDVIVRDRTAIIDAILSEAAGGGLYDRSTSSIMAISQGGEEVLITDVVDDVDVIRAETNFEVQVTT